VNQLLLQRTHAFQLGWLAAVVILAIFSINSIVVTLGSEGSALISTFLNETTAQMTRNVSPYLMMIVLFSFVWTPCLALIPRLVLGKDIRMMEWSSRLLAFQQGTIERVREKPDNRYTFFILSAAVAIIAYLTFVRNLSGGELIGYDTPFYLARIAEMQSLTGVDLLNFFLLNRFFFVLYPLSLGFSPEAIVRGLPVALGIIFVLSIYFLARRFLDGRGAAMAAVFASLSFLTLRVTADLFTNLYG
jgi:hypothetical protein